MNPMVIAALRRKRETYERAGLTDRVERIDARLTEADRSTYALATDRQGEANVSMTPAAQQRADELGLTAEDFKRRRPSGKTGFTVGDVERIAEARGGETSDEEGDD